MNNSTHFRRLLRSSLAVAIGLGIHTPACAQGGGMPVVSNVVATADPVAHTVTFDFNLSDPESDPLEVGVQIVGSDGSSYTVPASQLSGDVGYPVRAGTRRIVWSYNPSDPALDGNTSYRAMIVADDRFEVDIAAIVATIDSTRLRADLEQIVGIRHKETGLAKLDQTKVLIESLFGVSGIRTERQEWKIGEYTAANIIGTIPGTLAMDSIAILCAHYDSEIDAPGADDNGSGVVGMMEAVRALAPYRFRRTIRFIGFDQEEAGLVGSRRYTNTLPAADRIVGVLDYEMIGYYSNEPNSQQFPAGFSVPFPAAADSVAAQQNRGNFITNVANVASNPLRMLFDSTARRYVPELRVISIAAPGNSTAIPDLRRSDHAPFWDRGNRALMITDGANFRNPNYHTPGDTIGTLNFTFMSNVVKATVATLARLGGIMHAGVDSSNAFTIQIGTGVAAVESRGAISLLQNSPNPFGGSTVIPFTLSARRNVKLEIFDNSGRLVATPVDGPLESGRHDVTVDLEELPSGVYTYRLTAGSDVLSRMMWRVR